MAKPEYAYKRYAYKKNMYNDRNVLAHFVLHSPLYKKILYNDRTVPGHTFF